METTTYDEKNKELQLSIEELYHENRPSRRGQRGTVSPKSLHRIDFENHQEKQCHVLCPNIWHFICCSCCLSCLSCCCSPTCNDKYISVHCKRFTLPFVGVLGLFVFEEIRTFVYVPLVVFIASLSIFWNFPSMILFTNSKPFYYEDLFIDNSHIEMLDIHPTIKKRFETIFDSTLILSNSIFMGALSDYWLYKIQDKDSYFVIIGISGGILKIFQFANQVSGSILLYTIRKYIMKEITVEKSTRKRSSNKKRKNSFEDEVYMTDDITNDILHENTIIEMRSFDYPEAESNFTEAPSTKDSILIKRTSSQHNIHRPKSCNSL